MFNCGGRDGRLRSCSCKVDGLEQWGIRFIDIFNIIVQLGQRAFVYGGFIRDVFATGAISDDIDVLFTCSVEKLVDVCEARKWPYYLKKDPDTGAAWTH